MRHVQQRVGNFETVTFDENTMREHLVEGVDDAVIRRPAQCQQPHRKMEPGAATVMTPVPK